MSSVNMQTRRWCGQDHATVSVESSTSSDRRQRRPDVRRNQSDRIFNADKYIPWSLSNSQLLPSSLFTTDVMVAINRTVRTQKDSCEKARHVLLLTVRQSRCRPTLRRSERTL